MNRYKSFMVTLQVQVSVAELVFIIQLVIELQLGEPELVALAVGLAQKQVRTLQTKSVFYHRLSYLLTRLSFSKPIKIHLSFLKRE